MRSQNGHCGASGKPPFVRMRIRVPVNLGDLYPKILGELGWPELGRMRILSQSPQLSSFMDVRRVARTDSDQLPGGWRLDLHICRNSRSVCSASGRFLAH